MAKFAQLVVCLSLLGLALSSPVQAADDDLTSSAYLVFDPETGEFVTVHDPDRTQQDHAARDPASASGIGPTPSAGVETGGEGSPLATGVAVAVVLLGAFAWVQLKKRKSSQTDA
jgi:LPXTG-motif cell wall-anchored protein